MQQEDGRRPFDRRRLHWTAALLIPVLLLGGTALSNQGVGAQDWLQAGWEAYEAGHLPQAQHAFAKAAAASPESATPAMWMGAVTLARGDSVHAGHWFREVLLLNPTTAQAHYALAWLARLGQPSRPPDRTTAGTTTADGISQFILASNPRIPARQAQWEGRAIREAAAREGVDSRLMTALVCVESRFDQGAVSRVGARGLGQLMPKTAAELGVNPHDPWQNLVGSARLLRVDYAQFHSLPLTLAAYNAGDNAVRHYGGIPPYPETQVYVWEVLAIFGRLLV